MMFAKNYYSPRANSLPHFTFTGSSLATHSHVQDGYLVIILNKFNPIRIIFLLLLRTDTPSGRYQQHELVYQANTSSHSFY